MDAVRDWVGDFEIGKGRPYAENAVVGEYVVPGQISAHVRGTRPRPYRVTVAVAGAGIAAAECTCPVGERGKCKHVAAVLLAYVGDPRRFAPLPIGESPVTKRSQPELAALILELLARAPELMPVIAEPLPGFARGSTDPEPFRRRAAAVLRAWNPADDHGGEELEAALHEIARRADQFDLHEEGATANAVREGLRQAIREFGPGRLAHIPDAIPKCAREAIPPPQAENLPPF
jgi:uncharacterized Zn finger protein